MSVKICYQIWLSIGVFLYQLLIILDKVRKYFRIALVKIENIQPDQMDLPSSGMSIFIILKLFFWKKKTFVLDEFVCEDFSESDISDLSSSQSQPSKEVLIIDHYTFKLIIVICYIG